MSDELLIDVTPLEMRLAVRDNGRLEGLYVVKPGEMGHLPGTPVYGRIKSVVHNLDAAFVDIGFEQDAFLPLPRDGRDRFTEGAALLGQIIHDGFEGKGARISREISIAGKGMVLSIGGRGIRISRRIEDEEVRARLTSLGEGLEFDSAAMSLIWRTEAADMDDEALTAEFQDLHEQAAFLVERSGETEPGEPLLDDIEALEYFIDDLSQGNEVEIVTESRSLGGQLDAAVVKPGLFERAGIEGQVEALMGGRIELPGGGNIVVERTEAMTTIDVNTARSERGRGGRGDKRARAVDVNLEAAEAIGSVLRAARIGGLVAIDFLRMREDRGEEQVLDALRKSTEGDPASVRLGRFSTLGLVDLSRARQGPSLFEQMMEGRGAPMVRIDAAAASAVRKALKEAGSRSGETLVAEVSAEVLDYLQSLSGDDGGVLEALEGSGVRFAASGILGRGDVHFSSED